MLLDALRRTTYSFDDNGNETAAGSTSYGYDLANRMISATVSGTTTNYAYDGDGNRLQAATTGGSTTNYAWDTNQPPRSSPPRPMAPDRRSGTTRTARASTR